jgi:nucleoside-diphosphate-sugar epimerase
MRSVRRGFSSADFKRFVAIGKKTCNRRQSPVFYICGDYLRFIKFAKGWSRRMRIFVTGATGFIGSAVVSELMNAGHRVLGLARSDKGSASLAAAGAEVLRGSLEDLDSLRSGAANSDGVIHLAFIHDFLNYAAAAETDRRAIETLGTALAGSGRPLVVTSGTLLLQRHSSLATEKDESAPTFPRKSEKAGLALASRGVRASVVRLPPSVHGDGDHGFVPRLFALAREKGVSAYVGDGLNHWPAVHRLDAARLYRLALEKGFAGGRYHGVADEGVLFRDIARVIGRHLNVPLVSKSSEEAADHFGWISHFASIDCPASSAQTQEQLGWRPTHPSLIADIGRRIYFEAEMEVASTAGGK